MKKKHFSADGGNYVFKWWMVSQLNDDDPGSEEDHLDFNIYD